MMRSLVLALAIVLLGAVAFAQPAHAARTVNSALLTYATQTNVTSVTVPPGATISATVNVTHNGSVAQRDWFSTSWRIGTGAFTCVNHTAFTNNGTDNVTFNITAPAAGGTYNVEFIAWQAAGCTTNPSTTFVLAKGVVVIAPVDNSTVGASPTSVPADGFSTSTITVTIRDAANNPVAGKTVSLAALSGSSSISAASGPSNASGVVTFSVSDTAVESVTYRATNLTDGVTLAQTASVSYTVPPVVLSFNVVEPGADAFAGRIFTKIAGTNFALDIVARSGGAVMSGFTGTVAVEVVDSSGGGSCATLPVIAAFANQTFTVGNKGRRSLSASTVPNVYRDARVRVRFPAAAPTVTSCSGDNFAIRPESLAFTVTDGSRTTAGTTNVLNNTALPGVAVHNAGRPFTIRATAFNDAAKPAVTSNYNGTPSALTAACGAAACTPSVGTLLVGAWTAGGGGTVTTNTATYDDVGAFSLQLLDDTFAAIDSADGTPLAQRTISTVAASVGRFVPDRFVLSAASIAQRADIPACIGSTFTYMGERMDATFTLTAVQFPGGTTTRYSGALGRLVLTTSASFGFGAIDSAGPTLLTARLDTTLGSTGTWTNGVANVVARVAVQRGAAPDGPYTGVLLGVAPVDSDGVALDPAALDVDADNSGSSERGRIGGANVIRFGRLRLQNGHGSQLIQMSLPMEAQHWNGTAFVRNPDDNCTAITPAHVALGNYRRNLGAGETVVTTGGAFNAGTGSLRLSAPGAANDGSVDVAVNLTGLPAGASCSGGMPPSTPTGYAYLHGAWCGAAYDRDPTARATFGVYRNSDRVIFQRENY